MLIRETYINATHKIGLGESPAFDPETTDLGLIFRRLRRVYGACISKIYVDVGQETVPVGWVFAKTLCYEDCRRCRSHGTTHERFKREVWVTLQAEPDTTLITRGRPFRIDTRTPLEAA